MLTQAQLKEVLSYDPETGLFKWIKSPRSDLIGKQAGCIHDGYVSIFVQCVRYRAHRLAWLYMTGELPEDCIDHVDMDRSNNRFANLRKATRSQNGDNRRAYRNNKSGIKGVHFHKANGTWIAQIQHDKNGHYLGSFQTKEQAEQAVRSKRIELHGEFANHG